jgi:hypothetical protein
MNRPQVDHFLSGVLAYFPSGARIDEPTDLPEGTVMDLVPFDPGGWLDEAEHAALHQALRESEADVLAGRVVDGKEILKQIRAPKSHSR